MSRIRHSQLHVYAVYILFSVAVVLTLSSLEKADFKLFLLGKRGGGVQWNPIRIFGKGGGGLAFGIDM